MDLRVLVLTADLGLAELAPHPGREPRCAPAPCGRPTTRPVRRIDWADAAIIDLVGDGLDDLSRLRVEAPRVRILAIATDAVQEQAARSAGADQVLVEPFADRRRRRGRAGARPPTATRRRRHPHGRGHGGSGGGGRALVGHPLTLARLALVLPLSTYLLLWGLLTIHRAKLGLGRLSARGTFVVAFLALQGVVVALTELLNLGADLRPGPLAAAWLLVARRRRRCVRLDRWPRDRRGRGSAAGGSGAHGGSRRPAPWM